MHAVKPVGSPFSSPFGLQLKFNLLTGQSGQEGLIQLSTSTGRPGRHFNITGGHTHKALLHACCQACWITFQLTFWPAAYIQTTFELTFWLAASFPTALLTSPSGHLAAHILACS
jgi:hypothetical protein